MKTIYAFVSLLGCLLGSLSVSHAQILSVDPVFPAADDTITLIYDASQGNGELEDIAPVYAHSGVITSESSSPSDWKNVQGTWGTADQKMLMEDLGNNLHQIRYHIRSFYNVPTSIGIEELAFVFRNEDGSKVGRSETGADIYYPVYDGSVLASAFLAPNTQTLLRLGDSLLIKTASSVEADLQLFANGTLLAETNGKSLNASWTPATAGEYWLELRVSTDQESKLDSLFVGVIGDAPVADLPAEVSLPGITYVSDTSVILSLYAPNKEYALLIGDMNDWLPGPGKLMNQTPDGTTFWLQLNGLTPGEEYAYQYVVDGSIRIADPYTEKVLDPWNDPFINELTYPDLKAYPADKTTGIVSVFQTAQPAYEWQHEIARPEAGELIIYELLVRDFLAAHNYETLIDSLDYLEKLGVNAIELMPVNEFEGNLSWGYNPSFYFAPDKYYGTKQALQAFIDSCHARNMVVILDMVLNHSFGQSPLVQLYWDAANSRPSAESPWYNPIARHPFNVGYDFDHETPQTKELTDRVLKFWLEEYRFDGFRMDLSKGFTQRFSSEVGAWSSFDQSRIELWKRIYDEMRQVDEDAYLILEHFGDNAEEKILAEYGMLFWGNLNHTYNEAIMGYNEGENSNFEWVFHQTRDWTVPHVVGYMESHDEERLMVRARQFGSSNGGYDTKNLSTGLERMALASAFFYPIPGPKLIWQFGEMGYDVSIDENGRTGNKPILWNYLQEEDRSQLFDLTAALIHLRTSEAIFQTEEVELGLSGEVKRIHLSDQDMNLIVMGNFGLVNRVLSPNFPEKGSWYDYFSGDSLDVDNVKQGISYRPGEWHIYTDKKLASPVTELVFPETVSGNPYVRAFPNPTTGGELSIKIGLPFTGQASLDLFDLAGRKVATRSEEVFEEPGVYTISWDLGSMSAGTYLLRMSIRDWVGTVRLVVE